MVLIDTYRRQLHEVALDRYGYVTTADAIRVGIPPVEIRKLTNRGGITHLAYGIYRFDDIPPVPKGQYMEAVLRVGVGAHLTHDAVLAFHDLAHVMPNRTRVGTPRRCRVALPRSILLVHQRLHAQSLTSYEGVPSATVARAILDCKGLVMIDRLVDAAHEATRRGLVLRRDSSTLLAALEGL